MLFQFQYESISDMPLHINLHALLLQASCLFIYMDVSGSILRGEGLSRTSMSVFARVHVSIHVF